MKLELSDGQRALNLLSGGSIYAVQEGFDLPLPGRDVTYIEPVDGDGRRRIRTKDTNGEGRIATMISGTSDAQFWDNVDNLLELVQSAHRDQGSITYTPPGGTDEITWDLEAITVTGLPQKGQQLATRRAECEIAFETRPYGKLAAGTINLAGTVAPKTLSGPIDYATVGGIAGQIEAFADLYLKDSSSQNRRYVEIGVQDVFDPENPEPILLTAGSVTGSGGTLEAFAGIPGTADVPTGAYTTQSSNPYAVKCTVQNSAKILLGTDEQPHSGLWKVRVRLNADDPEIRVRLIWRVGSGPFTREQWRIVPVTNTWVDLDLGTINIKKLEAGHSWEGRIEGISGVGYPKVFVDYISLIPADRLLRLRGRELTQNASALIAADDFPSTGSLNSRTPSLGSIGNWATGGGTTPDFTITSGGGRNYVRRTRTSDTNALSGRFATFGTVNYNKIELTSNLFPYPSIGGTYVDYPGNSSGTLGDFSKGQAGLVLRYVDTNNHVKAFYTRNVLKRQFDLVGRYETSYGWIFGTVTSIADQYDYLSLHLQKVVGGTVTSLGQVDFGAVRYPGTPDLVNSRQLKVISGTAGDIELWEGQVGAALTKRLTYGGDVNLASGGTLQTGKVGFYHVNAGTVQDASAWYSVTIQDPTPDDNLEAVIPLAGTVEVTHDGATTIKGIPPRKSPAPIQEGEYLRLPPATRNQNQSRIVVRVRRDDIEEGEGDTGLSDQVEARLEVVPRVTIQ